MLIGVLSHLPTEDGLYELRGWFLGEQGQKYYRLFHSGINEEFVYSDYEHLFSNIFCLHKGMKISLKDGQVRHVLRLL